jgi:hypothetical protein
MAKTQKHPTKMTTGEAIEHLFHPKVVEGLKEHVRQIDENKPKKGATK